jgi:hypothetical protein
MGYGIRLSGFRVLLLGIYNNLDWIPVDILSNVIIDLVNAGDVKGATTSTVYNIVNPCSVKWDIVLTAVLAYFRRSAIQVRAVPMAAWFQALQKSAANKSNRKGTENPACNFLEFFQILIHGREMPRLEMRRTLANSRNLNSAGPIQQEWLTKWMENWKL